MKTAKERAAFREKPIWQLFRNLILKTRNYTCELCGKEYKILGHLNVHHKYETNYTDLNPSRFMVVCKTCHEYIHTKYKAPAYAHLKWYGLRDGDSYQDTSQPCNRK